MGLVLKCLLAALSFGTAFDGGEGLRKKDS